MIRLHRKILSCSGYASFLREYCAAFFSTYPLLKKANITAAALYDFLYHGKIKIHNNTLKENFSRMTIEEILQLTHILRVLFNNLPLAHRLGCFNTIMNQQPEGLAALKAYCQDKYQAGDYQIVDVRDLSSARIHRPGRLTWQLELKLNKPENQFLILQSAVSQQERFFQELRARLLPSATTFFSYEEYSVTPCICNQLMGSKLLTPGKPARLVQLLVPYQEMIITALAKEAALADFMLRIDRKLFQPNDPYGIAGNYLIDLDALANKHNLVVAFDFESFVKTSDSLKATARLGLMELTFLTVLPGYPKVSRQLKLFRQEYLRQIERLSAAQPAINSLLLQFGLQNTVFFNQSLIQDPSGYLAELWKLTRQWAEEQLR